MRKCECCGNAYKNGIEVKIANKSLYFDCFECAIERMAPRCAQCQTKIIGHGLEDEDQFFCCAHCARASGSKGFVDHVATG